MAVAVGDDILAAHLNMLLNKPIVKLSQQTAQSIPNGGAGTAVTFGAGSEEMDTHNYHDTVTNISRVTPQIAGYYECAGTYSTSASAPTAMTAVIAVNGTAIPPLIRNTPGTSSQAKSMAVYATALLNGTTDYVELLVTQTSGGAVNSQAGGGLNSVLEVKFDRPT